MLEKGYIYIKIFFVWRWRGVWWVLKSVDRKYRNVRVVSIVKVNVKIVFKWERNVFILF